jgi:hypothetical protein
MVNVLVNDAFLFPFRGVDPHGEYLDGAVRAVRFTDAASGATVLVVLVVGHDHFAFKTVEHDQVFPVLRILLRDDLSGTEEILSGDRQSCQERFDAAKQVGEIFYEAAHSLLKMPTH